ncbi:MAG: protein kinase, partial [bacterium]|nr:protein kinase [bacterium]
PLEASPAVEERPKLLVVIAVPDDLADYGLPELDRCAIGEAVDRALRPLAGLVSCELLGPPVTAGRLRDRLRAGGVHVLHVVAHGCVHATAAVASLVFEGDDRKAFFVDENLLAEIVEGDRDLRLVSLIACHSGAVSGTDPFRGLGPALVRRGVPAVVAMRRAIRVAAAALFSEHLFRDLARCGRIDAAVNEARQQLYLAAPGNREWGTPALYLRLREGRLWRAGRGRVPATIEETGPSSLGPYRLDHVLGRGGMGEVYKAWDERLKRWVAIKHLSADDPTARARLRREAQAAAQLGHPAIVQVFDVLEHDGDEWIVMELVDGSSLAELLRDGPLDPDLAIDYGRQVAAGLAAAHDAGIVHRDLKTENVMVLSSEHASPGRVPPDRVPPDRIKILDFGLAKSVHPGTGDDSTLSLSGRIVGTPRAMSSEQAQGEPSASDATPGSMHPDHIEV